MQDLVSDFGPKASEFYCAVCDLSIPMSEEQYLQRQGSGRLRGPGALRSP